MEYYRQYQLNSWIRFYQYTDFLLVKIDDCVNPDNWSAEDWEDFADYVKFVKDKTLVFDIRQDARAIEMAALACKAGLKLVLVGNQEQKLTGVLTGHKVRKPGKQFERLVQAGEKFAITVSETQPSYINERYKYGKNFGFAFESFMVED
ncbi:hypothetical protein [Lyngbya sp. CCY1209]|uniref:hypothetical protein n=1 Tax=Lyngbya sp. CCY1209 TaxID=2886103 RepID=UPI002D20B6E9|nr:hypothetical protein [Lyngbya sp. CCY1209]MEB3884033.1 hypothetical protein [Lyngbya sp. CCY1209]